MTKLQGRQHKTMMIFKENESYQHQHPQEWVNFLLLQPSHPHHVNTTDFSQDYFWPGRAVSKDKTKMTTVNNQ